MRRLGSILLITLLVSAAGAEEPGVLDRLRAEPISLFDWGLAQLDRDIERAALRTLPRTTVAAASRPVTGTIYDGLTDQVTIYVSLSPPPAQRTTDYCSAAFRNIVDSLTEVAPQGPNAAGWYLLNAFKPKGHSWGGHFEDVGAKLLSSVRLEVSFIPATFEALQGEVRRVRCAGRLNAEPHELTFDWVS